MGSPVGEKIRALRTEKGYTLDKLAELSESSKSYIWELENKNPPRPSGEKIAKIAKVLGVTPDYLLTDQVAKEDATDKAFFRKYQGLHPETKQKIRKILDTLDD